VVCSKRFKQALRSIIIFSLSAAKASGQGVLVVDQASGTTDEVVTVATVIPDNQVNTFYYPDNIGVTPGQLYFFEPVVLSAGSLDVGTKSPSSYLGGDLWSNGLMDPQADLWFREGIVVPEPSTVWLLAWGSGVFIWRWRVGRNSRL